MVPRVNSQRVSSLSDSLDKIRMLLCSLAYHEEGTTRPVSFQDIKNTRRVLRMRAVVECQSSNRNLRYHVAKAA